MIVNLYQHGTPSRPSSTNSRAGSRPPSARRLALKEANDQHVRPFSARTGKGVTRDQQQGESGPEAWRGRMEDERGADQPNVRRPITARARLQADASAARDTRIATRLAVGIQMEVDDAISMPGSSVSGGLGSRTPSTDLGLATVTEESQSWSRKDQQSMEEIGGNSKVPTDIRVDYQEARTCPLHRKGPRSPKLRRSGRRPYSAGLRVRLPVAGRSVSQGSGSYGGAWPALAVAQAGDGLQPSCLQVPQLVDTWDEESLPAAQRGVSEEGDGVDGQGTYVRRRLPLKDEFRQMVHDNKTRSEALKRSVEAIESLSGALDANHAEKQILVRVLLSCAQAGASTPRDRRTSVSGPTRAGLVGVAGRRSQTAFISQMLSVSTEERRVLESMPAALLDAVEDAMRTRMSYAEAVARMAELDEELLEWQRWYSKHGDRSVRAAGSCEASPRERNGGQVGLHSPRSGQVGEGPVAAAHLRSQLSQARIENEHLNRKLQQLQMHVMGKSPRGRESGSQLVVDLLHKDLAAAKAQNYVLQAEVASLTEHSRRLVQDSEQHKGLLHEQINALHMDLDTCKRELELARRRSNSRREQTPAPADPAMEALDDWEPKQLVLDEKGQALGNSACDSRPPATHDHERGLNDADFEWMPAILAHLEGTSGAQGSNGSDDMGRLDMLPVRLGDGVLEDGGLVLSGFEALSQCGKGAVDEGGEPVYPLGALMAVLTEFKSQLSANYRLLRSELRADSARDGGGCEGGARPVGETLIRELRLLQLAVKGFDAQLQVLHSPAGALAMSVRRDVRQLADAAAADGSPDRVVELVRELEKMCVASELRRQRFAGRTDHRDLVMQQQEKYADFSRCAVARALPHLSKEDHLARSAVCGEGESLNISPSGSFAGSNGGQAGTLEVPEGVSPVARTDGKHEVVEEGVMIAPSAAARTVAWLGALDADGSVDSGALAQCEQGLTWLGFAAARMPSSRDAADTGVSAHLHEQVGESAGGEATHAVPADRGGHDVSEEVAAALQAVVEIAVQSLDENEEGEGGVKTSAAPAPAAMLTPSTRAPSFKSKQPAALELGQVDTTAHGGDGSFEEGAQRNQEDLLSESMQLSVTADEDSLALSATPGDPSASFCKPSQEDLRQPHDADAELEATGGAADSVPPAASERAGPAQGAPAGVPPLAVHMAVAVAEADERDLAALGAANSVPGVPPLAVHMAAAVAEADEGDLLAADTRAEEDAQGPAAAHARATVGGHGSSSAANAPLRSQGPTHRPQSATASSREAKAALAGSVQRCHSGGAVLGSKLKGGQLSPVPDTSLTEPSGLGSEASGLAAVSHTSVCISDGSAESDEDVLADADLDDDEEALTGGMLQPLPQACEAATSTTVSAGKASREQDAELGHGSPSFATDEGGHGGQEHQGGGESCSGSEEESAREKERRLREQVDISLHKEMVQQYTQFEKIGSSLSLVAEDDLEVDGDDECDSGAAPAVGRSEAHEISETSWERREIETTPRGEHELRAARGDKPTRPDDRLARRAPRPADASK